MRSRTGAGARLAAAGTLGYLLGSLPSADLAARRAGVAVDLRAVGSGNPGALNAAHALGPRWGLAVLAADMAKGALAGLAGRAVGGDGGAYAGAAASIAGHIAPLGNGFRGGKGVATSAGACLAVFPVYFPVDAAVAAASALGSRRAGTAVRWSCAAWVVAALAAWRLRLSNAWGPAPGPGLVAFAVSGSAMILVKFASSGATAAPAGHPGLGSMTVREHPPEGAEDGPLAPTLRGAPAPHGAHAFHEPADDRKQEIDQEHTPNKPHRP